MNTGATANQEDVQLYAHACNGRFAMKQDGQPRVKEFSTLSEAIRFVTRLPHQNPVRIILHDEAGHPLTQLVLKPC